MSGKISFVKEGGKMNFEKLLECEKKNGFDDINIIRGTGIRSFLDEWVSVELLGRGSFGNVYKIIKPHLEVKAQKCALKICKLNNSEDAEIRKQEIETQKLLDGHPNAVQIEDYDLISREAPKTSYLMIRMELLNKLPENGLSEAEVIRLGIDICSVLERCESLEPKLVHCDIKPANILVDEYGRYKLGDFGTAKTLQATMTYTGNRGTPLYMAPEVAHFSGYDSRCDIFSLGYTMLTMLNGGKHPYEASGDGAEILKKMYFSSKLPRINGVGSGLMKILQKMCEPDKKKRYSSAKVLRHDLQKYIQKKEKKQKESAIKAAKKLQIAKNKEKKEKEKLSAEPTSTQNEKKLSKLHSNVEYARSVNRYVEDGLLYSEACRKADCETGRQKKKIIVKMAVITAIAVAAVTVLLMGYYNKPRGNARESLSAYGELFEGSEFELFNLINEISIKDKSGISNESVMIVSVTTPDGLDLQRSSIGDGYAVMKYKGNAEEVVIPAEWNGIPVIEIVDWVVYENGEVSDVRRITLPGSIRKIGEYAFTGCEWLEEVDMSDGLLWIENAAFADCKNLKSIEIPESVVYIGNRVFSGCALLEEIDLPAELYHVAGDAFSNTNIKNINVDEKSEKYTSVDGVLFSKDMKQLVIYPPGKEDEEYTVPDSVVKISDFAFSYSKIQYINMPETLSDIGKHAFEYSMNLKKFTVPARVKRINEYTFDMCINLEKVTFHTDIEFIGRDAFSGCGLTKLDIPEGLDYIEVGVFSGCSGLESVTIPRNIDLIGAAAFSDCTNLKSIQIPDTVHTIEDDAFFGCRKLGKIFIPDTVNSIGERAFFACDSMTEIKVSENNKYYTDVDGVLFSKNKERLIKFPDGKKEYVYKIPNGVKFIHNEAFSGSDVKVVEISESVTSIALDAFLIEEQISIIAPYPPEYYGYVVERNIEWTVTEPKQ